jgi:hypothetical protein
MEIVKLYEVFDPLFFQKMIVFKAPIASVCNRSARVSTIFFVKKRKSDVLLYMKVELNIFHSLT